VRHDANLFYDACMTTLNQEVLEWVSVKFASVDLTAMKLLSTAASDVASVHFSPCITMTDVLVKLLLI